MSVESTLRKEIERRERELAALRAALAALAGAAGGRGRGRRAAGTSGSGKRRPKTEEEKAVLSRKLKAAWKRRKAAEAS